MPHHMNPQIRMAFLAWLTTPLIAGMTAQAQPTNTVWTELGGGVNGPVIAVLEGNGDTLVVVGDFTVAGGVPANHVALWDGNSFSGMGSGVGMSNSLPPPRSSTRIDSLFVACHADSMRAGGLNCL